MKFSTGLKNLDKKLHGGLPNKAAFLLIGAPRTGKVKFLYQFVHEGIENKEPVIYLNTKKFPEDVIDDIQNIGKTKNIGLLRFIDCYTLYVGVPKTDVKIIKRVNGPNALNEINFIFTKVLKSLSSYDRIRLAIDSCSNLLLYNPTNSVAHILQTIIGKMKTKNSVTALILDEGVHESRDVMTITSLTDGTLQLERKKRGFKLTLIGVNYIGDRSLDYNIRKGKIVC